METKELDMILNSFVYLNFFERTMIENTILRNIILENQEINRVTKDKLVNRFLKFSHSGRYIEDEVNKKTEKKLKNILNNIKTYNRNIEEK